MLKHISHVVGNENDKALRQRLTKGGDAAVSAEWEVAVIYSLTHAGGVRFPTQRDSVDNPDILFSPSAFPEESVIVEVTAISDAYADEENPLDYFLEEMRKTTAKHSLNGLGALNFKIGGVKKPTGEMKLALPAKKDIPAFFRDQRFIDFVKGIKTNPQTESALIFEYHGAQSFLQFSPGGTGSHGQLTPCGTSFIEKTVSKRLLDKHRQIKGSRIDLPAVVVLCNNDCSAMGLGPWDSGPSSIFHIVNFYLNGQTKPFRGRSFSKPHKHSKDRINAVFVLSVKDTGAGIAIPRFDIPSYVPNVSVVKNRKENIEHTLSDKILQAIADAFKNLPPVKNHPVNAKRLYWYPSNYGGYQTGGNERGPTVKMSLLALQKLLSGEIKYEVFVRDHDDIMDLFKLHCGEGLMISDIKIEKCPDEDDDWVIFQFEQTEPSHLFERSKPA